MDSDVKAHELPELGVCEAKLIGIVGTVVERGVAGRDGRVVAIFVCEDDSCDARDLGAEVEAILQGRLPVLGLVDTALVSLHEVASWLACENTHGELGHSVHVARERLDHSLFISGEFTSAEEFLLEASDFRFAWKFTREEQPQDTLWNRLSTWDG